MNETPDLLGNRLLKAITERESTQVWLLYLDIYREFNGDPEPRIRSTAKINVEKFLARVHSGNPAQLNFHVGINLVQIKSKPARGRRKASIVVTTDRLRTSETLYDLGLSTTPTTIQYNPEPPEYLRILKRLKKERFLSTQIAVGSALIALILTMNFWFFSIGGLLTIVAAVLFDRRFRKPRFQRDCITVMSLHIPAVNIKTPN